MSSHHLLKDDDDNHHYDSRDKLESLSEEFHQKVKERAHQFSTSEADAMYAALYGLNSAFDLLQKSGVAEPLVVLSRVRQPTYHIIKVKVLAVSNSVSEVEVPDIEVKTPSVPEVEVPDSEIEVKAPSVPEVPDSEIEVKTPSVPEVEVPDSEIEVKALSVPKVPFYEYHLTYLKEDKMEYPASKFKPDVWTLTKDDHEQGLFYLGNHETNRFMQVKGPQRGVRWLNATFEEIKQKRSTLISIKKNEDGLSEVSIKLTRDDTYYLVPQAAVKSSSDRGCTSCTDRIMVVAKKEDLEDNDTYLWLIEEIES